MTTRQLLASTALATLMAGAIWAPSAYAQDGGAQPAPAQDAPAGQGQGQLPDVEIIQQQPPPQQAAPAPKPKPKPKPQPAAAVAKPKPKPKPVTAAAPPPPPPAAFPEALPPDSDIDAEPAQILQNSQYGASASGGAAARAAQGAQTPINPTSIIPQNLEGYAGAATNVTPGTLTEQQPRNINEVFTRVPGVIVINDDGSAHHGGIGVRGSPPRRSRKILTMEDGQSINLALWLDPSVHYFAPIDRLESVEIIRGTVITHGPNNNFGVVNARNLSPFGPNETVISSAIGFTKSDTGFFDDDGEIARGTNDTDISTRWHVHTRQSIDNVGVVFSYTGENVQGSWDQERLRFNDFYGAVGWKGVDQDLKVSVVHGRQRDNYDELNLTGEEAEDGEPDPPPGLPERAFFDAKHCKTCFAPGSVLSTYNADIWRGQVAHNYYLDDDTTITTRLYGQHHRRDRYSVVTAEDDPREADDAGLTPVFVDGDDDLENIVFGEDGMFGRLRTFRTIGSEIRGEFANRPFWNGMTQTIQTGIRYEYQDMSNRNFLGDSGEILEDGDEDGVTIFDRSLRANTVSAFLQSEVKVTRDVSIIPGVRLEWYDVNRLSKVTAEEEGEAEETDECGDLGPGAPGECLAIEGIRRETFRDGTDSFNALPGIAFAYNGFYRTTVFGGYHRGLSTAVLRNEDFPSPDEIGDNFQLGLRSTAFRGVAFEVAGFHQRLKDFQFGSSFSDAGDRDFGRADRVEINGVELAGRLNSQPFTGGPYNFFSEANYTYARSKITAGTVGEDDEIESIAGNDLPEVPFHIAALTLGVQNFSGWRWDASVTYTYRGSFFTDESNTPFGGDPEGEDGEVPDVWLLSARFNLALGETGASVFVAGDNLTDELYISDREDGIKPGIGRTVWTGFKYKF